MRSAVRTLIGAVLLYPWVVLAWATPAPTPAPEETLSGANTPPAAPAAPGTSSPAPTLFLEPVLGANAITLGWNPSFAFPSGSQLAPSLRAGMLLPDLTLDLRLGLSTATSPTANLSGLTVVSLDAEVGRCPYSRGEALICGTLGLGGGLQLGSGPQGGYLTPTTALNLGVGFKRFLTPGFAIGVEGGARTQLGFFNDGFTDVSTGLYVAFTGTWLRPWGLNVGGTRARDKEPGPPIASAPPPEQPPASTPGGPPPAYGTSSRSCTTYVTDGWFSPTQAVWQDDPVFEDRPRKQLTRRVGTDLVYDAELHMVQGKDTLLFGVHHYRLAGQQVTVDSRDFIVLKGMTNCTVPVPVKMRFTLQNAAGSNPLYTSSTLAQVPLEGSPAPQYTPWEVKLPVRNGLPEQPFRFDLATHHQLIAELIRESGAQTGLRMTVTTDAVPTVGPVVHFVPVLLQPPQDTLPPESLVLLTERVIEDSAKYIPDVFPLRPGGLPTQQKVLRNFIDKDIGSKWFQSSRIDALVAELNDSLAASAFLDGAGRVVAVMSVKDYEKAFGAGTAALTVSSSVTATPRGPPPRQARTLSWKVILTTSVADWSTIAHELVHTLPEGWSSKGMQEACGRDYHNKSDPVANGELITHGGVVSSPPERKAGLWGLMGPATIDLGKIWITQCTYAHLLEQLAGAPPDPPVLLVRAVLTREGAKVKGELRPMYELMGYADVAAGKGGPYAVVLRDAQGAELGRYPVSPEWDDVETGRPRAIVSLVFRVPALPGPAVVELVGPGGVLDRERLSARPPTLQLLTPAEGQRATVDNGRVRISWRAEGEEGRKLLYSVLYSSDGGEHFTTQVFELEATSFDVTLNPQAREHRVKVLVTDGTRSSEAVIPLRL